MAHLMSFAILFLLATVVPVVKSGQRNCSTHKMDLAFLVDVSGSICGDVWGIKTCPDWEACVAFIRELVNDMIIGENDVRVALTLFESYPWPQWNLLAYNSKPALLTAIDNLRYIGGNTNTTGALDSLSKTFSPGYGDRPGVRNQVILITDGKPRRGNDPIPINEIRAAVKRVTDKGILLLAVGVTNSIDMDTLKELSSPPQQIDETVFFASDYQSIRKVLTALEGQSCINKTHRGSTVTTTTPFTTTKTFTTSKQVTTTQPVTTPKPDCSTYKMDLAFLVDESGSICDDQDRTGLGPCDAWKQCIAFIHSVVNDLIVGENDVRVAMTLFQSTVSLLPIFQLNGYYSKSKLLDTIDSVGYRSGGTTDTITGLKSLWNPTFPNATFTMANGDRPNVRNVAIIITDGVPQINSDYFFSKAEIEKAVDDVTSRGIQLFAVGVTNKKINLTTLMLLSSPPHKIDQNVFFVNNYQGLPTILKQLEVQTCISFKAQPSRITGPRKP